MLPERLAKQLAFIQKHPEVRVTACMARYIDDKGNSLGKTTSDLTTVEKFHWYKEKGEAIGLLHPGVAMHRETILNIGGYRGQFWPADDIDLWNRLAEQGYLILVQDEVLMKYRLHSGSVITSSFQAGRLRYEWVRACMQARRNNQPEPDWETFLLVWKSVPWWVRLNRNRKTQAKYYYRMAGFDKITGKNVKATLELMCATILQPSYVLLRLKRQMGQ
jgi:hypothetical protein